MVHYLRVGLCHFTHIGGCSGYVFDCVQNKELDCRTERKALCYCYYLNSEILVLEYQPICKPSSCTKT